MNALGSTANSQPAHLIVWLEKRNDLTQIKPLALLECSHAPSSDPGDIVFLHGLLVDYRVSLYILPAGHLKVTCTIFEGIAGAFIDFS